METALTTPPSAPALPQRSRSRVAWSTVLPFALVLAYADGFWMTSLRGAVGAISRTQEPFTSYWRTSSLMVPVFVLAVLAAFAYAAHRFGLEPLPARPVVLTGVLVLSSATLAALLLSVGSAAYDYVLQINQLQVMRDMPGMQDGCGDACFNRQQWMTLDAHARAIAYTGLALLVTNAVVVTWLIALRGGRLTLVGPASRSGARGVPSTRSQDVRLVIAAALLASAVIHVAVVPEHLEEWHAAALFFLLLTGAEVAAATGLFWARGRAGRAGLVGVVVVSAVPLMVWAMSRTVGMPFGPEAGAPEAVGLADCVACLLEAGALVAALLLLRGAKTVVRPPLGAYHRALVVVAVLALGALGVEGAASGWFDGVGDSGRTPTSSHHAHLLSGVPR